MNRRAIGFLTAALVACAAQTAMADSTSPLPSETLKANTATTGKNEVAKGGFAVGGLPDDEDPHQVTEASIAAGGLFSSGNARTVAVTSIGKLRVRRDEHQFGMAASANFARAGKSGEKVDTTVENYQGLIRYDYFFTDNIAAFLQTSARHDRFQGLDLRYNLDPGVAYYFINTKKQKLSAEGGYDLQYDVRRDASRVQTPRSAGENASRSSGVKPTCR